MSWVFGCESTLTLSIPDLSIDSDQRSTVFHDPTILISSLANWDFVFRDFGGWLTFVSPILDFSISAFQMNDLDPSFDQ